MSKIRTKFESVADALSYLRKNKDIDVSEDNKVIKLRSPVGLKVWSAISFLTVKVKDRNHGWSYVTA